MQKDYSLKLGPMPMSLRLMFMLHKAHAYARAHVTEAYVHVTLGPMPMTLRPMPILH